MNLDSFWLVAFWSATAILVYTYAGFPALLAVRAFLFPRPVRSRSQSAKVSVVIAAHNEESVIVQRLDNIFGLDYPAERLEVIVASDGSDDRTDELVENYGDPRLRLLRLPRRGKNQALNAGVTAATGDIIVFTDADTTMAYDSLWRLLAPFSDPEVGGVGGDFRYAKNTVEMEGERAYWSIDRLTKMLQSRGGSMTSATGQIYAVRRNLYSPIPEGVTDDFYVSARIPLLGRRLVFEPLALAFGPITNTPGVEFRRKVRNITNGLNGVWHVRALLNPFRYGFHSLQLFTHKILRRVMVLPLIVLLVSSPGLWRYSNLYGYVFLLQLAFYASGWFAYALRKTPLGKIKALSLPFYFQIVNGATLVSLYNLLRRKQTDIWAPYRPTTLPGLSPESGSKH